MPETLNKKARRDGFYWVGERPFISVTEALKVINKPSIQYWYGQQVYREVIKDPCIDERTALAAPWRASAKAAARGTDIHSIIETFKHTGSLPTDIPEGYRGYATAFLNWVKMVKPTIQECEKTVIQETLGYAGTLDMLADIAGKRFVIDFKTNKKGDIYDEAHLQVSAYLHCLNGVDGGIIVGLAEDGSPTSKMTRNGFTAFRHALGLYAFINEDKLAKYGWKGEL